MREISKRTIVARWNYNVADVGTVKLFEREGDGGRFLKAHLWENFETVLENAAKQECKVELEFVG